MNGIERIVEYSTLPSGQCFSGGSAQFAHHYYTEPPRHLADVPAAWPFLSEGIKFENVVLRYASDLEPVLRGVSFHVQASESADRPSRSLNSSQNSQAGEKIGIVGRTGSGKSTLAMSLFRFVDPDSGKIIVGGWLLFFKAPACMH